MRRPFDILLMEDNPADVETTLEACRGRQSGNRIAVCRDGKKAFDYRFQRGQYHRGAFAPRPSLILLDMNLHHKSGVDVLVQIKNNEHLEAIPIHTLSTFHCDDDARRCYQYGGNNNLTKPVQFTECVKVVAVIQPYWLDMPRLQVR